jgi:hypothetical protein
MHRLRHFNGRYLMLWIGITKRSTSAFFSGGTAYVSARGLREDKVRFDPATKIEESGAEVAIAQSANANNSVFALTWCKSIFVAPSLHLCHACRSRREGLMRDSLPDPGEEDQHVNTASFSIVNPACERVPRREQNASPVQRPGARSRAHDGRLRLGLLQQFRLPQPSHSDL